MTTAQPLPCPLPWCASDDVEVAGTMMWPYVMCNECACECPAYPTEAEAIAAWNQRQPDPETARLSALVAWQPIADRPVDGREVLVGCWVIPDDDNDFFEKHWASWVEVFDEGPLGCEGTLGSKPTHWMPLPTPPASEVEHG